ncbi:putative kinase [Mucilaginibacter oryzae]|uniref:Putative kinase n=1 Tax=Mucilaginibacter oryzae TaxID=468058 RepID=A0A316HEN6_9SPHI|nr:AAA family ATPase [Mucilaginibacter oryzae]PWK79679.1 putative kinase [Mucilaginibacter oryzae]
MLLILFRGRPGTGKTTMSNLLSSKMEVPIIRKDDIYDQLVSLSSNHDLRNKATFDIIYSIIASNIHSSSTLIVDCPFQFEEDITSFRVWCRDRQVRLKTILVTCSDEHIWSERFKERAKNPAPNQLITDFEVFKKRYKIMQLQPDEDELLIDTIGPQDQNIKAVLDFLNFTKV